MKQGGIGFVACSSFAIAACSTPSVQVRAVPDPAAKLRQGGDQLGGARNMLALGNVGLALEGFRKEAISQPTNPDVYRGIAQCYAAMGRYDLERSNLETALAYAPHDPQLLGALANSLERQGESARAMAVRAELALLSSPAPQARAQESAATQVVQRHEVGSATPVPQVGSITVMLPPARPVLRPVAKEAPRPPAPPVRKVEVAKVDPIAAPKPVVAPASVAVPAAMPKPAPVALEAVPVSLPQAPPEEPAELAKGSIARVEPEAMKMPLIAVAMPVSRASTAAPQAGPARPAAPLPSRAPMPAAVTLVSKPALPSSNYPSAADLTVEVIAMEPAIKPRDPDPRAAENGLANGPRLERVSFGEVALVTTTAPMWKVQVASRAPEKSQVQWLPIRSAEARPPIQLLNAARSQGLAAWTRMALVNRGWRRIGVGNYGEVRQRSLVLYSGDHAPLARRLAAQLACKVIKVDGKSAVIVLLGRDAALRKAATLRA